MFDWLKRQRIHEPIAIAALLAACASLHVAWLLNILRYRSPHVESWLLVMPDIGTLSGIYLAAAVVYALTFGITTLWLKGRDCSGVRDRVFWFYVTSVAIFATMTIPYVFAFEILPPSM